MDTRTVQWLILIAVGTLVGLLEAGAAWPLVRGVGGAGHGAALWAGTPAVAVAVGLVGGGLTVALGAGLARVPTQIRGRSLARVCTLGRRLCRVPAAGGLGLLLGLHVVTLWTDPSRGEEATTVVAAVALVAALLAAWRPLLAALPGVGVLGFAVHALLTVPPVPGGPPDGQALAPRPDAQDGARDVILVTLDTFRADHLECIGGYRRPVQTPRLCALAEQGVLYSHGLSPVPLTLPSHAAMLSGQHPVDAGVLRNGDVASEDLALVPVQLRQAGYQTGGFVSAIVLRRIHGLHRGFDTFGDRMGTWDALQAAQLFRSALRVGPRSLRSSQRRGDATLAAALEWWREAEGDRPRFLWLHLYDPHAPYDPPAPYADMYDPTAPDAPGQKPEIKALRRAQMRLMPMGAVNVPRDLAQQVAHYAGEITWTDALVGQLVDAVGPDVGLVIAADHGESLVEHDYILNHGQRLYEPSVRVPILVVDPQAPVRGETVETPVPLDRVAGTLLDLAGVPRQSQQAPSLLESQPADAPADEGLDAALVTYSPAQQARRDMDLRRTWRVGWRTPTTKWIVDDRGNIERYDLLLDPLELDDTHAEHPQLADQARDMGAAFITDLKLEAEQQAAERTDAATEALRALGYVE